MLVVNSSLDILWLSIALVVLWIGVWLGISAMHLALSIRDVRKIITGIKKKIEAVNQAVASAKSKIDTAASIVPPVIDGVVKVVGMFKDGQDKKKKKGK